jgi:hypothetical protein
MLNSKQALPKTAGGQGANPREDMMNSQHNNNSNRNNNKKMALKNKAHISDRSRIVMSVDLNH